MKHKSKTVIIIRDRLRIQAWFTVAGKDKPTMADFEELAVAEEWIRFKLCLHPDSDDFGVLEVLPNGSFIIRIASPHVMARLEEE